MEKLVRFTDGAYDVEALITLEEVWEDKFAIGTHKELAVKSLKINGNDVSEMKHVRALLRYYPTLGVSGILLALDGAAAEIVALSGDTDPALRFVELVALQMDEAATKQLKDMYAEMAV
ncbi:hypothetical protein EVJ27_01775 [Exiguobacterium sp. SH3S2]|uniref:hypothetical protein n=1 Tax=unclassified Exiguobacterium TaxID=2644629 RepID=UPI000354745C|nr:MULTISPECIES: hypothetical protein [unclassified Exiguobacterium]EPE61838.1 hypothetical protein L479_01771 [Exiguobacterium sp. S17]OGX80715.1 hypothetical protein A6395_00135 [Exiguobacterium sp. SH31]TCI24961.1 hypothetical protein EVJ32_12025 [Exiguobacterium sp. SH5S4]TCI37229.1 hypothetical protein EVJ29_04090 [Exiguobacterium sp. SH4S7]TCI49363.1 hypothetical protein EVJ28_01775 [Exiguobacterium sp. SH3S3]